MSILDAKDLLVHSPLVISNTTKRMYDIKLLRYRLLIISDRPAPARSRRAGAWWQEGRRRPARAAALVGARVRTHGRACSWAWGSGGRQGCGLVA